ncbi:MAG: hypothetical protein GC149_07495 [Gammaproteobacteria bacterium]|nr:hypothetical protein [Gammaproteobacteria bacterium]
MSFRARYLRDPESSDFRFKKSLQNRLRRFIEYFLNQRCWFWLHWLPDKRFAFSGMTKLAKK